MWQPDPFPHTVVDGWFADSDLRVVVDEWPALTDPRWRVYGDSYEAGKMEGSNPAMWGPTASELLRHLCSGEVCRVLGELTGIDGLVADTIGGGLHCSPTGARLAMHVDFNRHPNRRDLYRRLNLLVFLVDGYDPAWGGQLLLGQGDGQVVVEPRFNRTAVFATSEASVHGHPTPWAGPVPRRSIAVYYFAPEPPERDAEPHSTTWHSA